MDPVQNALRRRPAHLPQRLANGREPRTVKRGGMNIVKANHGDVDRNTESKILERAYRANGRHIVKGNYGCEPRPPGKHMLHYRIAQFGRVYIALQLHDVVWFYRDPHLARDLNDTAPAIFGI